MLCCIVMTNCLISPKVIQHPVSLPRPLQSQWKSCFWGTPSSSTIGASHSHWTGTLRQASAGCTTAAPWRRASTRTRSSSPTQRTAPSCTAASSSTSPPTSTMATTRWSWTTPWARTARQPWGSSWITPLIPLIRRVSSLVRGLFLKEINYAMFYCIMTFVGDN